MAVCFWYLVKKLLVQCTKCTSVQQPFTGQVKIYKTLEKYGHVYLIGLFTGILAAVRTYLFIDKSINRKDSFDSGIGMQVHRDSNRKG